MGRPLSADDVDRVTWSAAEFSSTLDVGAYPAALASVHGQGRRMAAFHEAYDSCDEPDIGETATAFRRASDR